MRIFLCLETGERNHCPMSAARRRQLALSVAFHKCFLRGPKMGKSQNPRLPTKPGWEVWTSLDTVRFSHPVITLLLDSSNSTCLTSDLEETPHWSTLLPSCYKKLTPFLESRIKGVVLWWEKCLHVTVEVWYLPCVCSYIHVRVHFSASGCLPYELNSFVFTVLD